MTVGDWMITLLILSIPIVNIIAAVIWLLGSNVNPNKANLIKAWLVFLILGVVIFFLFFGSIAANL